MKQTKKESSTEKNKNKEVIELQIESNELTETKKAKKAVSYVRSESWAQEDNELGNVLQAKCNQLFAAENGYSIVKTFEDIGQSGNNIYRPGCDEMLEFCESHKNEIDAIIVWRFDRISNNMLDYYKVLIPFFMENNIKLLSATENNNESLNGIVIRNISFLIAETYEKNCPKIEPIAPEGVNLF